MIVNARDRRAVKKARQLIAAAEHEGVYRVFAQLRSGDDWKPVTDLKIKNGIIWVSVQANLGNFMAHEVKIME